MIAPPLETHKHVFVENITTGFVRYMELNPTPSYWKPGIHPLQIKFWTSYVGSTSYSYDYQYFNPMTGELLATALFHSVKIDVKTRRPTKIGPDELDQRGITRDVPPRNFVLSTKPAVSHLYSTKVLSSDTDKNQHLNMSVYIKYFMDAGSSMAIEGKLTGFHGDLAYYDIVKLSITFLGEAVLDDELKTACWEDARDAKLLNFEMLNGSKVISQCQIKFAAEDCNAGKSRSLSKL